jgi:hypothetical protein
VSRRMLLGIGSIIYVGDGEKDTKRWEITVGSHAVRRLFGMGHMVCMPHIMHNDHTESNASQCLRTFLVFILLGHSKNIEWFCVAKRQTPTTISAPVNKWPFITHYLLT